MLPHWLCLPVQRDSCNSLFSSKTCISRRAEEALIGLVSLGFCLDSSGIFFPSLIFYTPSHNHPLFIVILILISQQQLVLQEGQVIDFSNLSATLIYPWVKVTWVRLMKHRYPPKNCVFLIHKNQQLASIPVTSTINITGHSPIIEWVSAIL